MEKEEIIEKERQKDVENSVTEKEEVELMQTAFHQVAKTQYSRIT
jgi:hypothetical protein